MTDPTPPRFVLASASRARLRTLAAAGIDAEVIVSGVDEDTVVETSPQALCAALARMKATAVAQRVRDDASNRSSDPDTLVLGCDSVLAFDGEILGKPADAAEAVKRWTRMRGRSGVLHTGHCLIRMAPGGAAGAGGPAAPDRVAEAVASTTVRFADVSDAEIDAYVATGEPLHVAGAFTIDGIGGAFVDSIDGDAGTVIGLSLPLLRRLLGTLDVRIYGLWRQS